MEARVGLLPKQIHLFVEDGRSEVLRATPLRPLVWDAKRSEKFVMLALHQPVKGLAEVIAYLRSFSSVIDYHSHQQVVDTLILNLVDERETGLVDQIS